ncbi:HEPN domain-containing protein [Archaeoglobus fulgidus]|uniref:HEPN domain-containing protein n=1 Tax=Archaeoglobus fulgidus DSM 8774 TaxID=1344584 RepID=A0A075WF40_ARCFL|nr:HEPN domain-containing protein [Archaeoglobus fulgidus]AIG98591.1 hypothetical protein AFULGI_00018360 [Archaeoglobus fulgidus DSM 8774]
MEFLKNKALRFYSKALESFEKGEYDFTMFFVEQTVQLAIKYLIARRFGEIPKTHNLRILFEIAEQEEFYRNNLDVLREIELAYTASRYFDVEYSKEIAEKSLSVAKKVIDLL